MGMVSIIGVVCIISFATILLLTFKVTPEEEKEAWSLYSQDWSRYYNQSSYQKYVSDVDLGVEPNVITPETVDAVVSDSADLNTITGYTAEQFNKMLSGTPLAEYGYIFVNAEVNHGVNGLFMAALTGQEQNFGASESGCKAKLNLTSYMAYDSNVSAARTFASYDECIDVTAKLIKKSYLTVGGTYYNGATPEGINVRYASDKTWAAKIKSIMVRLQSKLQAEE